jgi:hypothetical protein
MKNYLSSQRFCLLLEKVYVQSDFPNKCKLSLTIFIGLKVEYSSIFITRTNCILIIHAT